MTVSAVLADERFKSTRVRHAKYGILPSPLCHAIAAGKPLLSDDGRLSVRSDYRKSACRSVMSASPAERTQADRKKRVAQQEDNRSILPRTCYPHRLQAMMMLRISSRKTINDKKIGTPIGLARS
jgi:hypothetical protein